jgi:predicted DNA-binding protein (UPF0251 family)
MGNAAPELDPDPGLPESQEEIREASMRLPVRQREALDLREVEGLSYDEIATIMEVNRGTVALLISQARINLVDELRGTALASAAAPSPECERALPLVAMREDGQLNAASNDAAWLDGHLAGCERCRLGVEVMREAGVAYSAWVPTEAQAGTPSSSQSDPGRGKPPRRRVVTLAVGLAALLLRASITAVLAGDDPTATPADTASEPSARAMENGEKPIAAGKKKEGAAKKKTQTQKTTTPTTAGEAIPISAPVPTGSSTPSEPQSSRNPGKAAIQPTQQTSAPKSKPKPAPAPPAQPASVPTVEESPPLEEPSRGHQPHGKPPDHSQSRRGS